MVGDFCFVIGVKNVGARRLCGLNNPHVTNITDTKKTQNHAVKSILYQFHQG